MMRFSSSILKSTVALSFVITIIGTTLYGWTDSHFRADIAVLLASTDCASQCWLNIEVGVTTDVQAMQIIDSNNWITVSDMQFLPSRITIMTWCWNQSYLVLLPNQQLCDPTLSNPRPTNIIFAENGIVRFIRVETRLTYHDIVTALGDPHQLVLMRAPQPASTSYEVYAIYENITFVTHETLSCRVELKQFQNIQVDVYLESSEYTHYRHPSPPEYFTGWDTEALMERFNRDRCDT